MLCAQAGHKACLVVQIASVSVRQNTHKWAKNTHDAAMHKCILRAVHSRIVCMSSNLDSSISSA
eukprot:SAG11_NODE_8521_length_1006_cov_1.314223_1_plen_64_part_00